MFFVNLFPIRVFESTLKLYFFLQNSERPKAFINKIHIKLKKIAFNIDLSAVNLFLNEFDATLVQ